jgi:DNA-binding protein H-NS
MAQTYLQLKKHIAELQAQADEAKRSEVAGVIAKAREAIEVYGLTRQDLFGAKGYSAVQGRRGAKGKQGKSIVVKYTDGKGGVWGGRGKRPQWLNNLLSAGARLEDFLVSKMGSGTSAGEAANSQTSPFAAAPAKRAVRRTVKKAAAKTAGKKATRTSRAKYQDGEGNSWSGFGPRPRWLKAAIAGGKKIEDFLG